MLRRVVIQKISEIAWKYNQYHQFSEVAELIIVSKEAMEYVSGLFILNLSCSGIKQKNIGVTETGFLD